MSLAPVPFKELLEGATPGPWKSHLVIEGNGLPYTPVMATTLIVKAYSTAYGDYRQSNANAAYIARCNPATMAVVWEALVATRNYGIEKNLATPTVDRAIALLNGTAKEEKP